MFFVWCCLISMGIMGDYEDIGLDFRVFKMFLDELEWCDSWMELEGDE